MDREEVWPSLGQCFDHSRHEGLMVDPPTVDA